MNKGKWTKARVAKMLASRKAGAKLNPNYGKRKAKATETGRTNGKIWNEANTLKQLPDFKAAIVHLSQVVDRMNKKSIANLTHDEISVLLAYKALTEKTQ